MRLNDIGEEKAISSFIEAIQTGGCKRKDMLAGPGEDDCAVVLIEGEKYLLSSDLLTRTKHFPKEMSYWQMGWSLAAVNFSDIASMGGTPLFLTVSIAIPNVELKKLLELGYGLRDCATEFGAKIVGGDLNHHSELVIDASVFGKSPEKTLRRKNAQVGDYVCVTGELGSAYLGVLAILDQIQVDKEVKEKAFKALFEPYPRVKEGIKLSKGSATSAIDCSDGLWKSLYHICSNSNVGAKIESNKLPVDDSILKASIENEIPLKNLVGKGSDYELLFTTPNEDDVRKVGGYIIGKITEDKEINLDGKNINYKSTSYNHFE